MSTKIIFQEKVYGLYVIMYFCTWPLKRPACKNRLIFLYGPLKRPYYVGKAESKWAPHNSYCIFSLLHLSTKPFLSLSLLIHSNSFSSLLFLFYSLSFVPLPFPLRRLRRKHRERAGAGGPQRPDDDGGWQRRHYYDDRRRRVG